MNYYLVSKRIAEELELTGLRKCTPGGMYMLSEHDLAGYGIDKALQEDAIVLSSPRKPVPGEDLTAPAEEQENEEVTAVQEGTQDKPASKQEVETNGEEDLSYANV